MEDLSILRRSILWNLEQKELTRISSSNQNTYEVELALSSAYQQFCFITAEIEDREMVAVHAARLLEEMWEPAISKLNTGYGGSSENGEVRRMLAEIVRDTPIGQAEPIDPTPASAPRPGR